MTCIKYLLFDPVMGYSWPRLCWLSEIFPVFRCNFASHSLLIKLEKKYVLFLKSKCVRRWRPTAGSKCDDSWTFLLALLSVFLRSQTSDKNLENYVSFLKHKFVKRYASNVCTLTRWGPRAKCFFFKLCIQLCRFCTFWKI